MFIIVIQAKLVHKLVKIVNINKIPKKHYKCICNRVKMSTANAANNNSNNNRKAANAKVKADEFRYLAAFDFDYTIVAQNTDTVARDILAQDLLPDKLNEIADSAGWTEYMAAVFRLLHEHRIMAPKICDIIRCIPEVPGFVRLLKCLHKRKNFDLIIISDSNSVFIAEWLQAHGLADCFLKVFTNPAQFEPNGLLTIKPYHHQTDCRLSTQNLCKGKVLDHFITEQDLRHNLRYERVIYVGDGNNDVCPVLRLRSGDIACARQGFALDRSLEKRRDKLKVRADVIVWKSGFDLMEQLESALQHDNLQK